jgi:hypothetical protein
VPLAGLSDTPDLAAHGQSVSRKTIAEVPLTGLSSVIAVSVSKKSNGRSLHKIGSDCRSQPNSIRSRLRRFDSAQGFVFHVHISHHCVCLRNIFVPRCLHPLLCGSDPEHCMAHRRSLRAGRCAFLNASVICKWCVINVAACTTESPHTDFLATDVFAVFRFTQPMKGNTR